jgi:hypothetical protein
MNKRHFLKTAAAAAAVGAAGPVLAQQTVTLRLHQMLPQQATIPARALIPWAQKVEKDFGGASRSSCSTPCNWAARRPSCLTRHATAWWT